MGKIYVIANRKGGCAKTTTTGAMASGLTRAGYKVLVIDMDPQGNISDWANVDTEGKYTIYEVLKQEATAEEAIVHAKWYDIIPADDLLTSIESEIAGVPGKEARLKEMLEPVKDNYDFIIIDTPPALGYLTIASFTATDGGVIITSDTSSFATKGMSKLVETLNSVKKYFNPEAKVIGILMTRVNPQTRAFKTMAEITAEFGKLFDAQGYDTFIRQTVLVMQSQMAAMDLFENIRACPAKEDYANFLCEFLEKEGYPKPDKSVFGLGEN